MADHSQGAYGQIIIEPGASPHTFDASSHALKFLSETMSERGRLVGGQEIGGGTLQIEAARIRNGIGYVFGEILMSLSPNDVDFLAANVWSFTESPADTFAQSDALNYFGLLIDLDYNTAEFKDCMITDWEISGRAPQFGEQGEPDRILLKLGIRAKSMVLGTSWPGTPPTLGTAAADGAYVFQDSDGYFTFVGAVRPVQAFRFGIDRGLYTKYANSLVAHSQRPTIRHNKIALQFPWNSDNVSLYNTAVAGAAGSFKFVNGAFSTLFNLGRVHFTNQTPVIRGKTEVALNVTGLVTGTGATVDVQIVNDNTP
jgi:hypothetical protein